MAVQLQLIARIYGNSSSLKTHCARAQQCCLVEGLKGLLLQVGEKRGTNRNGFVGGGGCGGCGGRTDAQGDSGNEVAGLTTTMRSTDSGAAAPTASDKMPPKDSPNRYIGRVGGISAVMDVMCVTTRSRSFSKLSRLLGGMVRHDRMKDSERGANWRTAASPVPSIPGR